MIPLPPDEVMKALRKRVAEERKNIEKFVARETNVDYLVCNREGEIKMVCNGEPANVDSQAYSPGWFAVLGSADQETQWVDSVTKEIKNKQKMKVIVKMPPEVAFPIISNLPPETRLVVNDQEHEAIMVTDGVAEFVDLTLPGLYEVMLYAYTYLPTRVEIVI